MRRPAHLTQLVLALALAASTSACLDDDGDDAPILPGDPQFVRDPALDVDNVSKHEQQRSHNQGQNCMHCHQAFGPGRGRFTVGVTVVGPDGKPHANPVLELYAARPGPGVLPDYVLEGDALGNVFSTQALPYPGRALFPVVRSRDGKLRNQMPFPSESGACNLCHRPGFAVMLVPVP